MKKTILLLLLCCLLAGCTGTDPEPTQIPTTEVLISTEPAETTPPTEAPEETTQPAPEPVEYVLSFVGDCCLANLKSWPETTYFMGTVGDDYSYPFANVLEYFENDDCTFINLENPLTDGGYPANKSFVFRGLTSYTGILTQGSVEFANVANNHSMDYGRIGFEDTLAALDSVGIHYAVDGTYKVFTTESGLTIGIYARTYPEDADGLEEAITAMREEGAEIVIICFHWGNEYYYKPNHIQTEVGRAAIDAGADIVYGHHSHVLQPVEEYNGGVIFYSLGNFCFGGNTNPADKDSAILQQVVIREPDGTVHLGDLIRIPCSISSTDKYNDFQPTPMDPESELYNRVLSKLDGSWKKTRLTVTYRPELG